MSVGALGQPNLFAGYGICTRARPKTRSGPPIGAPEIFVPVFCSAVGLLASMPYLSLLSNALADESTFAPLMLLLR
jgi:hypothetical protein